MRLIYSFLGILFLLSPSVSQGGGLEVGSNKQSVSTHRLSHSLRWIVGRRGVRHTRTAITRQKITTTTRRTRSIVRTNRNGTNKQTYITKSRVRTTRVVREKTTSKRTIRRTKHSSTAAYRLVRRKRNRQRMARKHKIVRSRTIRRKSNRTAHYVTRVKASHSATASRTKRTVARYSPTTVRKVIVRRRAVVAASSPGIRTVKVLPARRRAKVVTYRPRRRLIAHQDAMLGVGLRLSAVTVEGEKLNLATVENPTMGGLGIYFRGKASRNIGLELSADYLTATKSDLTQTTIPVTLSLLYYLSPQSPLKLYGLLGGGVHLTKLEYKRGFRYDLVELAGQAGGGVELRFSPDFGLTADLRAFFVYKNLGTTSSIQTKCVNSTGSPSFCSGIEQAVDDKFNLGLQATIGATLYF